jgi:hypothetical protein
MEIMEEYEYKMTLKIDDVEEEFYFYSDHIFTKQNIVDNMQIMKRKNVRITSEENKVFNDIFNMFGFNK